MKKTILLILLFLFFPVIGFAQDDNSTPGNRNLATPADRLIGHWSNDLNEQYYYGKITDSQGSYSIITPDGKTLYHQYEILSQNPAEDKIVVQLLLANGNKREETYVIPKGGGELIKVSQYRGMDVITKRFYVDDNETP